MRFISRFLVVFLFVFFVVGVSVHAVSAQIALPFNAGDVDHLPAFGADAPPVNDAATGGQTGTPEQNVDAVDENGEIGATTFQGNEGIRKLVGRVISFLKLFLGAIAILILFISGFRLVTAGSSITDEITKQKSVILYTIVGLVMVTLGESLANLLLGSGGDAAFIVNEQTAILQGAKISRRIVEVINYFLSFVGAGAILMLVIAGTQLVLNPGDETEVTKKTKMVGYTATGIVMIAMSEFLVNRVVFREGGTYGVDIKTGVKQLVGLSNYVLGFMGVIILVTLVIGGFMLFFYAANEEVVSKVKSVVGHVIIGALVSYSAYTIVATIVNLSYRL
jgi:hypothetical protein